MPQRKSTSTPLFAVAPNSGPPAPLPCPPLPQTPLPWVFFWPSTPKGR